MSTIILPGKRRPRSTRPRHQRDHARSVLADADRIHGRVRRTADRQTWGLLQGAVS
jgi:hypothetical protein